jgi:hypothetical protein
MEGGIQASGIGRGGHFRAGLARYRLARGGRLPGERGPDDLAVLDDHRALGPGDLQALGKAGEGGGRRADRADRARGEPDDGQRGVLDLDVVRLRRADRRDLGDRPQAPAEQVHVVDTLVEQGPAVHRPGAAPVRLVVIRLRAVPLRVRLGQHEPAQGALVDQLLELDDPRVEPVLRHHRQRHSRLPGRGQQPVGGLQADVHRLLHDQVPARPRRADTDLGVQSARHADAHHVDVGPREQGVQAGLGRAAASIREGPGRCGIDVCHCRQSRVRQQVESVRVDFRDRAGADDSETVGHGTDATGTGAGTSGRPSRMAG